MRLAVSVVLLVLALGGAGALAVWGMEREAGETDAFPLVAVGPEGPILDVVAIVPEATALSLLLRAAEDARVEVTLERYPGMGTYVRAIAGFEASGASGWVYEVERGGVRVNGDRSAEAFALQKGDSVHWSWTTG